MAQTAKAATLVESIGSYTKCVVGVAGGTGTSTTVTIPQFLVVEVVIVGGATSATSPYVDTISTNTFTATHADSDLFAYIAYGKAKV